MRRILPLAFATLLAAPAFAQGTHIPATMGPPGMVGAPPFSSAVWAGNTLYVAGTTDMDPATGKPGATPTQGAKLVLDNIKRTVEKAGLTMDDLVWVQVFATDLKDFGDFNAVYRTYFKGPMPARAFIGAGSLLGGAHFEVMGIAVKAK
jgi:2-iminobutanoate/2-iminopropanoate deaminase